jgi:hypothetical protein
MDDAELHLGLGIHRLNGLGKAVETITAGNQNILEATIFKVREDFEPEFRPFRLGLANPETQEVFVPLTVDAQLLNVKLLA